MFGDCRLGAPGRLYYDHMSCAFAEFLSALASSISWGSTFCVHKAAFYERRIQKRKAHPPGTTIEPWYKVACWLFARDSLSVYQGLFGE